MLRYVMPFEIMLWVFKLKMYRGSVAGSVIQATGTMEFEDGLWIGNHLKAQIGLQRARTIPGVQPGVVRTLRFLKG